MTLICTCASVAKWAGLVIVVAGSGGACTSSSAPLFVCLFIYRRSTKMESPEYEALNQCSTTLFSCIQQSPSDIVDKLKPPGLLAPGVLSFLGNPIHDDSEKARKIIDVMIKQVEIDSQVFHIFVKALKAAGPWTKGAVTKLENKHKTLLSSTSQAEQPKDPGEGEQLSLGGSDSTTQVQAAPISDTPLPQSGK